MAKIFADITPLRRYPAYRRLWIGQWISSTGNQLTNVGVAVEVYRITHSSLMVGLVSLAQLIPLIIGAQVGGALADAHDRRKLLMITQVIMAATTAGLLVNALTPHPSLWPLFVCSSLGACFQGADNPTRRAAISMLVKGRDITGAVALQTIQMQWALVVGPAVGGLIIAAFNIGAVFAIDVATFGAALVAVVMLPSLVPAGGGTPAGIRSLTEGFSHLKRNRLLASTFAIDINAMVFGMPRALFPALATGFFHGGAGVIGVLYAAPGAGALIGSVLTGWVVQIRHQGRAVILSVIVWGGSIALFGVVRVLWIGVLLLALAGAADLVSAVFRQAILQITTPEHLQGRLSGTFFSVVAGGPRIGDAEAGAVAALATPQISVWSGGLACIVGAALIAWKIPELWRAEVDPDALHTTGASGSDPDDPKPRPVDTT